MSDRVVIFKTMDQGGIVLVDSKGNTRSVPNDPEADVVFVIDTTGSMDSKIKVLLATCQKFVDGVEERHIGWQAAVVAFGDLTIRGDTIQATGFSRKAEVVKHSLEHVPHNSGGGNEGESSLEALDRALSLKGYRTDAIKVIVLLTDDYALQHTFTPDRIIKRLKQAGVLTFVISDDVDYYRRMASETGGKWWQISSSVNFLSILDELFKKVTETVVEVQTLADGNVAQYLQLKSGK